MRKLKVKIKTIKAMVYTKSEGRNRPSDK